MSDKQTIIDMLDGAEIDYELPNNEIVVPSSGSPNNDGYMFFYAVLTFNDDGRLVKWSNWE